MMKYKLPLLMLDEICYWLLTLLKFYVNKMNM